MSAVLWNVVMALIWAAITGNFSEGNLLVGFALGAGILYFTRRAVGAPRYPQKLWLAMRFVVFFMWELVKSNIRVAYDVITPMHLMRPAIIAVPLDARTEVEISLLASLITLTPGTAAIEVTPDRRVMYIHVMYAADPDRQRMELKAGFERRLLELTR